ncbi:carboxylesterase/lipase family protein [Flavihumibacter fluvii]|uniref:carboxylesterase/lipase family protein n=1 Tax=Flavihumibacter fluvii TaxID=2838157 RepID=UPI001EFA2FDE|nr:carboxylesterase family protein [Flavihumibacter fluvii]ULQ53422.1 carboxylesterase family protein [Flavihumibacter fluvii]
MMLVFLLLMVITGVIVAQQISAKSLQVKIADGIVEGVNASGIRIYKGIPFAAPPVGELRWKAPQPVKSWAGTRKAHKFGPRAMQRPLFSDMQFRSDGMSEDCLYLNVWTPAKSSKERLPVLVYFYGGGLMTGDGSEYRYDGENMSRQGIVAITVNYRVSVFGFFAHPELTKESPHHASGNYGLMDQAAALQWVKQNIAAFGGDPDKVTIAGESAGSFSVSAQMASPLAKHLINGAIGESGSLLAKGRVVPLKDAEALGLKFAAIAGAKSLEELRKLPAEQVLEYSANHEWELFPVTVDGYFLPKAPDEVYAAGEQSKIPLLAGWNSEEGHYTSVFGDKEPTEANFKAVLEKTYGGKSGEYWKLYGGTTVEAIKQGATDLASDNFIGYGTWKWSDLQSKTGSKPVYRYFYTHSRPALKGAKDNSPESAGAVHSAEIEYAMGNLPTNKFYDWQPEDYTVSQIMQGFFVNFIKTGNPNGTGLPAWTPVKPNGPAEVMIIDVDSRLETEKHRDRYLFLDKNL